MKPPGVYAEQTVLFDLIDRHVQIEKVVSGCASAEGPVFSRTGSLQFSDTQRGQIFQWRPGGGAAAADGMAAAVFRDDSGGAAGLTIDHQGRLLVCESGRRCVTRLEKDGSRTILADECQRQALTAPHDLVYGIDGSVYFTDGPVPDGKQSGGAAAEGGTPLAAVYRIVRTQIPGKSAVECESTECARPAGVALSPKQDLLYVSDAAQHNIRVHAIADDGSLAAGRVFAEIPSDGLGAADGLKTDESGNVYLAGPGGVRIFSAAGEFLGMVVLPEEPTNLCWGAGFSGLYVTAGTGVYRLGTKNPGTRTY